MRIIFMGTPDFATGTLQALYDAGHKIVMAVTQPDKPAGRGKNLQSPPVKVLAKELGIPVYQPEKVRHPEALDTLRTQKADIMVVVAFGQILPKEVLDMTPYGCINVHASLLPAWRGAAPIQWSILAGDKVTGVTTMQMDEGLDTGDMLLQKEIAIEPDETGGSLFDKLAQDGAALCVETLAQLEAGTIKPVPQGKTTGECVVERLKTKGLVEAVKILDISKFGATDAQERGKKGDEQIEQFTLEVKFK